MEDLTDGIDGIAGEDAITIFRGNTRVSTTLKQDGNRAVGTQAGEKVVEAVIGRGERLAVETDVLGVPYFTCYLPIVSASGERIGMFFVGAPSAPVIEVQHRFIRNMILTIIVLVLIIGVLPIFSPAAVPGLFLGCLVANIFGGAPLPDVVFGSLATLLGAVGTRLLRQRRPALALVPPIVANMLIVPLILRYAYGVPLPIPVMMATVGVGELISCGGLGLLLIRHCLCIAGDFLRIIFNHG